MATLSLLSIRCRSYFEHNGSTNTCVRYSKEPNASHRVSRMLCHQQEVFKIKNK